MIKKIKAILTVEKNEEINGKIIRQQDLYKVLLSQKTLDLYYGGHFLMPRLTFKVRGKVHFLGALTSVESSLLPKQLFLLQKFNSY